MATVMSSNDMRPLEGLQEAEATGASESTRELCRGIAGASILLRLRPLIFCEEFQRTARL